MITLDIFTDIWNHHQDQTTPRVHLDIMRWLTHQLRRDDPRALLMAFRSCGKSSLIGLLCAWLLYKDPNLRILVVSAEEYLAGKMVRNVRRILEEHILCQHLKPEKPEQWAAHRLTVARDKTLREPSLTAVGVRGNMTGARADIILCDDVEVPNTCDTFEKRQFLRQRLRELDFILILGGAVIYIGTPHCYETIYSNEPLTDLGEKEIFLKGYQRLLKPIQDKNGESAWPERFTSAAISRLRQRVGPHLFASQMMLQSVAPAAMRLDITRIKTYEHTLNYSEAQRQTLLHLGKTRLVSASCWWDPSFGKTRNDASVVCIVFTDQQGHYYVHDVEIITAQERSDQDNASQQCQQVIAFLQRNYLDAIHVESNGIGKFLPSILRRECRRQNLLITIIEEHSRLPKNQRILAAFDALLAAGSISFQRDIFQKSVSREMREWRPEKQGNRDDQLDAIAGAILSEPVRIGSTASGNANTLVKSKPWRGNDITHVIDSEFNI